MTPTAHASGRPTDTHPASPSQLRQAAAARLLDVERHAGRWNGDAPAPKLPPDVVEATSKRYLEAYRRLTGAELVVS